MSQPVYCRLCLNTCDDYESVYDVHGEKYQIMNKLCPFRLLLETKQNPSRVICLLCWRLISNFNHYRESVKKALVNLCNGVRTPLKLTALQLEIVCDADQPNLKCYAEIDDVSVTDQPNLKCDAQMDGVSVTGQHNPKSEVEVHISKKDSVICAQIQSLDEPLLMKDLKTLNNSSAINKTAPTTDCCNDNSELSSATVTHGELQLDQFDKQTISTIKLEDDTLSEGKPIEIISVDDSSKDVKPSIDETGAVIDCGYPFVINELDDDQHQEADTSEQQTIPGSSGTTSKPIRFPHEELNFIISNWRSMLSCYVCHETFSNFKVLRHHFSVHHPGKKCSIRCCNRDFLCRSKLAEHARYHLNPQCFTCDLCVQKCRTKFGLKRHRQQCHSNPKNAVLNQ